MKLKKTVFITGSSTGIGRSAAFYFQAQGWNVIATMRAPEKETELIKLPNVICPKLDVNVKEDIKTAISEGMAVFGKIDVLVNNAGYGLTGPFEGTTQLQLEKQFGTNVFGPMNLIHALLPHMREEKSGVIINIASVGGRVAFPLYSLYHATKWAIDGFSESLQYELKPFGIKVKIIEPGVIKTDFYQRSNDSTLKSSPFDYLSFSERGLKNMEQTEKMGSDAILVAKAIYQAATDNNNRLRYPVGVDAKMLLFFRKFIPDSFYAFLTSKVVFRD